MYPLIAQTSRFCYMWFIHAFLCPKAIKQILHIILQLILWKKIYSSIIVKLLFQTKLSSVSLIWTNTESIIKCSDVKNMPFVYVNQDPWKSTYYICIRLCLLDSFILVQLWTLEWPKNSNYRTINWIIYFI